MSEAINGKQVNAKNFKSQLSSALKSVKSMRDRVQALIVFAVQHYAGEGNGNTLYLSTLLNSVIATPGLNTRAVQAYIQAAANVKWTQDSAKNLVFKKRAGENGEKSAPSFDSTVLVTPWYQWAVENMGSNNAKADWEMAAYAAVVYANLKKHHANADEFARKLRAIAHDSLTKEAAKPKLVVVTAADLGIAA